MRIEEINKKVQSEGEIRIGDFVKTWDYEDGTDAHYYLIMKNNKGHFNMLIMNDSSMFKYEPNFSGDGYETLKELYEKIVEAWDYVEIIKKENVKITLDMKGEK